MNPPEELAWRPAGRWCLQVLGLAALLLAAGVGSRLLAVPPGYAMAAWLPAGLALGAVLSIGCHVWPGIWLGSFAFNLWLGFQITHSFSPTSVLASAAIGFGSALQACTGQRLVRRWLGWPNALEEGPAVLKFLVLAAPVACLVSATVAHLVLWLTGLMPGDWLLFSWWNWWVGDCIGVLIGTPLVLLFLGEPRPLWRRRRLGVGVPLVLTYAGLLSVFFWFNRTEAERVKFNFNQRLPWIEQSFRHTLEQALETPQVLQDTVISWRSLDQSHFEGFAARYFARQEGLRALEWIPRIPAGDRAACEHELQQQGGPTAQVTERNAAGQLVGAVERAEYFPVVYVYPRQGNEAALGYDLGSDPVRRAALEQARDTGRLAATERIRLVQDTEAQWGILVFGPVYAGGTVPATLAARRQALRGFTLAVIQVGQLVSSAIADVQMPMVPDVAVRLEDQSASADQRLLYPATAKAFEKNGTAPEAATKSRRDELLWQSLLPVAGRNWRLTFTPTDAFLASQRASFAWGVLLAGALFAGLLGAFLLTVTGRAARIEALVAERTAEVQHANRQLAAEVEERKRAEAAAVCASRAKSDFLATMSHEIRTPMNAILGFTQLLIREPGFSPVQRKRLQTIGACGEHLLSLVNDILELSKIEAGRSALLPAPFDLAALLQDLATVFQERAQAKGLSFQSVQPEEFPDSVVGDEQKLRVVLTNLLSNALKFTERGSITFRSCWQPLGKDRFELRVEIQDTGPGISPEDRAKLFHPFQQAAEGQKAGTGSGLGLAISQEFVRLMHGEIRVESQPGSGSRFGFTIQLQSDPRSTRPAPGVRGRIIGLRARAQSPRVLLVDDQPENRTVLAQMLSPLGFDVREAATGPEALELFGCWRPELVLMDTQLPGMNGNEAIRRLRASSGGETVKILTVSASAFEEDRRQALAAGADDFLPKPVREGQLLEKARRLLELEYVLAATPQEPVASAPEVLTPQSLRRLPEALRDQLREAALLGDFDRVKELTEVVAQTDASLGQAIGLLAERFDAETLLQLLESAPTPSL